MARAGVREGQRSVDHRARPWGSMTSPGRDCVHRDGNEQVG